MIIHQMLLIPRILLHTLVVLNILETHLAETIEVGNVAHLRIEELGHQSAGGALVVNLLQLTRLACNSSLTPNNMDIEFTCVHLLITYFTINPLVMGADTFTM